MKYPQFGPPVWFPKDSDPGEPTTLGTKINVEINKNKFGISS